MVAYKSWFFARSLTLVPRSLLGNCMETFVTQATYGATDGLLPITRGGSQILFLLKEIVICIVPFCVALLSLRVV